MEPVMMRSAVMVMMMAALMIQRTAAYPGYPGTTAELKLDTTTEGTTTELKLDTTTEQLTPASFTCPPIECDGPNCYLDTAMSYCGECICSDPICMRVTCGPGEECVPNEYNSYDYTCVSTTTSGTITTELKLDTTTEQFTPPSFTCPPNTCDGPNCYLDTAMSYCGECICSDPICMRVTCGPDEQCVPNEYNSYDYTCVSTTASETPTPPTPETPTWPPTETPTWTTTETPTWTTTETPTWTTPEPPTLPNCPDVSWCGCRLEYSPGEECPTCICYDPPCMFFSPCGSDEECVMNPDDPWDYTCVPNNEPTLTTETAPTPTPSVTPTAWCPEVTCRLDCDRVIDSNGCPICDCDIDPCTGTPNPGRCGRGSKTRWTYNSLTDRCESFRYYGCTPSPNTFRSRKECKNKCSGNSQIICPDLACAEDDCYTLERKNNKCPLCICPNPCKGFKCRKGYECKMRESKCNRDPRPFCAKKY